MAAEPLLHCNVCGDARPADKIVSSPSHSPISNRPRCGQSLPSLGMTSRMGVVNGIYTDRYVGYCIDRDCAEQASGGARNESLRERIFQRWFNRPME